MIHVAKQHQRLHPHQRQRRDLDLGRWLRGSYRIPTEEGPEDAAVEGDDDDSPFSGSA